MSLPSLHGASRSLYENSDENSSSILDNSAVMAPTTPATNSPGKQNTPDGFAKELARIQEEQVTYIKKIEKEKRRKEYIEENLEEARRNLRLIQDKTKNGNIVKDHDVMNKKLMNRLEYQLQTSKIKLSTARNENINLKRRVEDLRREKLLHLQILNDLLKEASSARRRTKFCQKEVGLMNEKKHKVKVAIATIKQKMVRDMEEFSNELNKAKETISNTQMSIMSTIREKLEQTSSFVYQPPSTADSVLRTHSRTGVSELHSVSVSRHGKRTSATTATATATALHVSDLHATSATMSPQTNQTGHSQQDAESVLKDTEFNSVEALLTALQQSEETVFALYHETQARHEEVEKMELENKHLEAKVQEQMKKLHKLESQQEQVKQEVEKNILSLKNMIAKYDVDYSRNMEVLSGISENLMNLLKNVAVDEAALDQQLLSTGINDRNIDEFLGLIEQRIDDLIQMSKAASHQAIKKDDFVKIASDRATGFQAPTPPSLQETNEEDDEFDEGARLQPLNIPMLKEIIHKKVQKMSVSGMTNSIQPKKLDKFSLAPPGGMKSRQQSNASIRSAESGNRGHQQPDF